MGVVVKRRSATALNQSTGKQQNGMNFKNMGQKHPHSSKEIFSNHTKNRKNSFGYSGYFYLASALTLTPKTKKAAKTMEIAKV